MRGNDLRLIPDSQRRQGFAESPSRTESPLPPPRPEAGFLTRRDSSVVSNVHLFETSNIWINISRVLTKGKSQRKGQERRRVLYATDGSQGSLAAARLLNGISFTAADEIAVLSVRGNREDPGSEPW